MPGCKHTLSIKKQALFSRVSVGPFTRQVLDLDHAPNHAYWGTRSRPLAIKGSPSYATYTQTSHHNSLKILIFLLTCFSMDYAKPLLFCIKVPNLIPRGEPAPRLRHQEQRCHAPRLACATLSSSQVPPPSERQSRSLTPTSGRGTRLNHHGMSFQPLGNFNLHLQKMALTPKKFGAFRVT